MDDSAKIKKNYKLMGTESDPVVIAQRLLNLYRQLHIFSPEKKQEYNKMLMEQTPEVKKMLGALPGGVVVQQYLAEIEKDAGVTIEEYGEGEGAAGNYQSTSDAYSYSNNSSSLGNNPEAVREIAKTFKEAIISSEKNRKEDTKELAQTIVALQSRLTQTIMEKQTKTSSLAQSQMIKDLAEIQTKEFSQIITQALKEIRQMSNDSLVDAIQKVHRANIDFFRNSVTANYEDKMNEVSSELADDDAVSLDEYIESGRNNKETAVEDIPEDEYLSELAKHPEELEKEEPKEPEPQIDESLLEGYDGNPADLEGEDVSWKAQNTVSEQPQTETGNAEDSGDYEWEYVEEDEKSEDKNTNAPTDVNANDYEWEYVEEEEDNTSSEAPENEDDYEWEYVEEDDSLSPETTEDSLDDDPYNPDSQQNAASEKVVLSGTNDNINMATGTVTNENKTEGDFGAMTNETPTAKSS